MTRAALASVVALSATRAAVACPDAGRPWVRVVAAENDVRTRDVARLLGAELAARHIDACDQPAEGAPPPLAVVTVRANDASRVTVSVDVHDAVTEKTLARDVALEGAPPDARALTVALAADELLRASWAELALRSAPTPKRPVPVEVRDVVRDAVRERPRSPRVGLGASAALDAFADGTTLLGADVVADVWIVPRVRAVARFGLRSGLVTHAADGDVATSAMVVEVGAAVTLTPPAARFGLDLLARAGAIHASFTGAASGAATGRSLDGTAVVADAGVVVWARLLQNLRAAADVAASLPLAPVEATDAGRVVGGIGGAGLAVSLGLVGTF